VIRLWNAAAERVTGVPADEAVGRAAGDAVPGWDELVADAPVGAEARPATLPLDVAGNEVWLSIVGVALEEGTAYAFRDLTEERLVEKLKTDFVATVSHELRTPLAAIHGSAQTLLRRDLELDPAVADELLTIVADESDRLARIVNDLLVASHVDSGRLPVHVERCDPVELARSVVDAARTHAPEHVDVRFEAQGRVPAVTADPGQLRQVLANLVDNAVKYSPEGGPVVVRVRRENGRVSLSVTDNGLGIPPSEQRRIFEKFYRSDPNMTRGIGGTGLGLYISRELVRRVGGRIRVESDGRKGATFVVELPAAERAPRRERAAAAG
jgi:signal transduction histidine kinase